MVKMNYKIIKLKDLKIKTTNHRGTKAQRNDNSDFTQTILNFLSKCPSPFLDGEGLRVRQKGKITPKQSW
jgi:hypothetical protein